MEFLQGIHIPVEADSVLDPEVYYGDKTTGIFFETQDGFFGRITFYALDAIKVCRGEAMPYKYDWENYQSGTWIFRVQNSKWLKERFNYENEHCGNSYQFDGNVNEMLSDFSHYYFLFHDQFVEVIARGFWFEKDTESLFGKALKPGHPFLPLPETGKQTIIAHNLVCQIRTNKTPVEEIILNSQYCPQKLFEFALELDGQANFGHTVTLSSKNGELTSSLNGYFGNEAVKFNGIITLEQVKPYIETHMHDVYERRKAMGKN